MVESRQRTELSLWIRRLLCQLCACTHACRARGCVRSVRGHGRVCVDVRVHVGGWGGAGGRARKTCPMLARRTPPPPPGRTQAPSWLDRVRLGKPRPQLQSGAVRQPEPEPLP